MVQQVQIGRPSSGPCHCHVELDLTPSAHTAPAARVKIESNLGSAVLSESSGCSSGYAVFVDLLDAALRSCGGQLSAILVDEEDCKQAWVRIEVAGQAAALGPIAPGVGILIAARRNLPVYLASEGERLVPLTTQPEVPGVINDYLATLDFSGLD